MKTLTVYKASAGSGKTFTLATEYIKLLIQNPASYRNILAVTFTNKATEEMKMRILSQLYGIWKLLPDSEQYIYKVCRELDVSRQFASQQAGTALSYLIHHYNYFRVETIDAFFQTVLRNLARELELTANLRVELNDNQVEELAVDQLVESLQSTDLVLKWILNYISSNISDDKSWNVIGQIKSFGKTIFRDYYKERGDELARIMGDEHFFADYVEQLRQVRQRARDCMTTYAEAFFDALDENGLTPELLKNGRRGISSYFNKLRGEDWSDKNCLNVTLSKSMESPEEWSSKSSPYRAQIVALALDLLIPLLRDTETARVRQWRLFLSADLTLRHLNQLRLLGSIETKVRELNMDANRFLLSDTQHLLHTLIDQSDSPFIFEKIGSQLEHVMIDEFQDTSTVQWQNFKELLSETMSHGKGNLIVGDVKQSIYRWRSGDWRLLNDIQTQFSHADKLLEVRKLDTNYRSTRCIVDFNNAFFSAVAEAEFETEYEINPTEADQLRRAYDDVAQRVPDDRPAEGRIDISLLPQADYQANVLDRLTSHICQLVNSGIAPGQIAILVRTNRYIPMIADYLMHSMPDIKLVSDEAFRLDSSAAVRIIVLAMRLLTHPADDLTRASLVKAYQCQVMGNKNDDSQLFADVEQLNVFLPTEFVYERESLRATPLMELAERLYAIFQLSRLDRESAYVCTFFDCIADYVQDNATDIDHFVTTWEESLCSKTIQSDEVDGLRIISIHKSKGLEFDHVVVPFCDWMLEMRGTTLWCEPTDEPFSRLPLVPIDYSARMMDSIYADDYRREHLQNSVDNLNLLYVAFTRAAKSLFAIGRRKATNSRSAIIEQVLPQVQQALPDSTLNGSDDDGELTFGYGTLPCASSASVKRQSRNVFSQPVTLQRVKVETFRTPVEFRQSNRSRDFVNAETDSDDNLQQTYIKIGNVLHNLFATIRTTADIPQVLRQLESDGVLYDDDISADRIRTLLQKRLSHPKVADWFSGRWQLFNECTILAVDPTTGRAYERRPDRVMSDGKQMIVVDFKFGRPRREHHEQVREYMRLLSAMGHAQVTGCLWYVYTNQVEEVQEP